MAEVPESVGLEEARRLTCAEELPSTRAIAGLSELKLASIFGLSAYFLITLRLLYFF